MMLVRAQASEVKAGTPDPIASAMYSATLPAAGAWAAPGMAESKNKDCKRIGLLAAVRVEHACILDSPFDPMLQTHVASSTPGFCI